MGTVVTIDAAGCQRAIASAIHRKKGDYVLIVKKNQEHLCEDIEAPFQALQQRGFQDAECTVYETHDKGHGRGGTAAMPLEILVGSLRGGHSGNRSPPLTNSLLEAQVDQNS